MRNQFKLLITVLSIALISKYGFSQADISGGTGHVRVAGYYCGWNAGGTAGSFDLRNDFAGQPINFFTGGAGFQRGTILGTNGFWGIGLNFTTPNQLLTVNSGNINVQDAINNNGYMIGNVMTMWRGSAGSSSNIFVGGNAGNGNSSGINNTFVGNLSGFANSVGSNNTFVGFLSGFVNDGADDNTFLGYRAGRFNTGPANVQNTYVGSESGFTNTGSTNNTHVGFRSGFSGSGVPCKENTLIGSRAGFSNQGTGQTFVGFETGFNQTSPGVIGNTFVGRAAA